MGYDFNISEEELKIKIGEDFFGNYDTSKKIGNIDFSVCIIQPNNALLEQEFLLWAEAKKGSSDIYTSLVQLILTIGKARTFDSYLPPQMLAAFDCEKIAFIPYNEIQHIFYINDFNWNVTSSNKNTKEFKLIYKNVKNIIDNKILLFYFLKDKNEIDNFIKHNFKNGKFGLTKTQIDKNNFIIIYNKWLKEVKNTISFNWDIANKDGIIDGDFYLADLLSTENITLKEKLFVVLKATKYELNKYQDKYGAFTSSKVDFNDLQKAHNLFWNKYQRPPKEAYWEYIIERRDLLVPQDIRERKGSFFTPQIWVELSQKYLTEILGEDWQDEYYVWDCAAGTGNLLNGLSNKYNIWASTLDKQDVNVMYDRIDNGANLLKDHVFQFDFLNDDFTKLPLPLQEIINNPIKRKKLVIYINPPYAEATSAKTVTNTGKNKSGVSKDNKISAQFKLKIGNATNEIFALFMAQVYEKLHGAILAQFSTLKFIQGSNYIKFKTYFLAEYLGGFIVPSNTFDNVTGKFPIGFTCWNLSKSNAIKKIPCAVYNEAGIKLGKKYFYGNQTNSINKWIIKYNEKNIHNIGYLGICGPDFQNNKYLHFSRLEGIRHVNYFNITAKNLIQISIYFSVRHCIKASWLNDRDQFLYPNNKWKKDVEFKNNCLIFALFHGQNRITSKDGVNNWIPFTELEVNAREKFDSNFMHKFIQGKIKPTEEIDIFTIANEPTPYFEIPLVFSTEGTAVMNAGRELWRYYHQQKNCNVNASLYDIKEYFQGRNENGKMNVKSNDEMYLKLIINLRDCLKYLAQKIEQKVYEYDFLLA